MKPDQTAAKLAELRAKTDRQVIEYIREQLNAAARYAFEADQATRTKNFARARRCRERADSAIRLAKELKAIVSPQGQPCPAHVSEWGSRQRQAEKLREPEPALASL